MPAFSEHVSQNRVKLLLVGDSGVGKTALLASLPNAGYKLRVLDFDDGLDILKAFLTKEGVANTHFITLTDDQSSKKSALGAAQKVIFEGWESDNLGSITSWGSQDVLVIDSLTFLSEAAKRAALVKAGKKTNDQLSQADWGNAQRYVSSILAHIMSRHVACNVVVTAHMQYIDEEGKSVSMAYPASCGRSMSTTVGRYFNNVWRLDVKLVANQTTRTLRTVSDTRMSLRNTNPAVIKANEDEPDLATLFTKLKGD